jgi:hypothetical protein
MAQSVYNQRPIDAEAVYFTPENFKVKADGKTDVSEALQKAVNQLKTEKNFGVLFIPEGKYLISRTIHIPKAIRLIGYGKNRPEIILAKNTPGFQNTQNYMIWFTDALVAEGEEPRDAGAGTFYSAISNIDLRIEGGNPMAVALRTHFAQHSFVSHCNLNIGKGFAGIYDVGNEMENVKFYGGQYGISTSRTSPGWPMMMVDLYFEGQQKAAILSRNAGLTMVAVHIKNTPVGVELQEDIADRLFLEDCLFENVGQGVVIGVDDHATNQVNIINTQCRNVPVFAKFTKSGKSIGVTDKLYRVRDFTYGLIINNMTDDSRFTSVFNMVPVSEVPTQLEKVIPDLPAMETWVNIKDLGARGDGLTDDTKIFTGAIAKHKNIYVPAGWYRITETLKLGPDTRLIGLHPFATQLMLLESEPGVQRFRRPQTIARIIRRGRCHC